MFPIVNNILICAMCRCGSCSVLHALAIRKGIVPRSGQLVHYQFHSPWSHNWGFHKENAKHDKTFVIVRNPLERLKSAKKLLNSTNSMVPRNWDKFLDFVERQKLHDQHLISSSRVALQMKNPIAKKIEEAGDWLPELGISSLPKINKNIYTDDKVPNKKQIKRIETIYRDDYLFGNY